MAGGDSRLFNLLSYAVCGGYEENVEENGDRDTLSNIHDTCLELIERDYKCEILKNVNGHLCSTYPEKLIIPVSQKHPCKTTKLMEYILKGRFARTRGRFVVPVLLVNGKYICRSSTLARSPEIYCRRSYGYWVQGEAYDTESEAKVLSETNGDDSASEDQLQSNGIDQQSDNITRTSVVNKGSEEENNGKEWLLGKMRNADINLLQFLEIDTIFDLMVENKKVKFGMNVTSSEKVDRQQRYLKFNLLSVPYPGCEFFAEYRKLDYCAEGLMFDWKQNFVDADLRLPTHINYLCDVTWEDYMKWDLVQLTQNYLKLHLRALMDDNSTGILLHCISGWDRTPLFVSLMRLSLWADGLIHKSLNPEEMLYFTVAYDWLLFCHRFSDRIANGEEIFYFCFDFLKHIYSEEYSMLPHVPQNWADEKTEQSNGSLLNGSQEQRDGEKDACNMHDNHAYNAVSQSDVDGGGGGFIQSNGVHHQGEFNGLSVKFHCENGNDKIIYSNWENSLCSSNEAGFTTDDRDQGNTALTQEPSKEVPAELEVTSCDSVQPSPNRCINCDGDSTDSKCTSPEANIERFPTMENGHLEEAGNLPTVSTREEKLKCVRELLIETYQAAIQLQQDRQQASNSGFAATLFSQLSKTLNLGKR